MNAALLLCLLLPLQTVDPNIDVIVIGPGDISAGDVVIGDIVDSPEGTPPTVTATGAGKNWIEVTIEDPAGAANFGSTYELRYSTAPIVDAAGWSGATPVAPLAPPDLGLLVTKVEPLSPSTAYWFVARWVYVGSLTGPLSGNAAGTTLADSVAPGAYPSFSASGAGTHSMSLTWTCAQNDGGTASDEGLADQELRYAPWPIDAGTFSLATKVALPFLPGKAFATQTMEVTGLEPNTTYFFALRGSDLVAMTPLALTSAVTATEGGGTAGSVGTSGCGSSAGGAPAALVLLGLAALLRIRG